MKDFRVISETSQSLLRKVVNWHNDYIKTNSLKENAINFFNSPQLDYLCSNFTGVIVVMDFTNKTYLYTNSCCDEMFGYSREDFKNYGLELVLKILQPDHCAIFVNQVYPAVLGLYEKYAEQDLTKTLKVTYTNQVRVKDGTFKWMLHQVVVLETDEKGTPVLVLKTMSDIDEIKKDKYLDFIVSRKNNKGLYQNILKKSYLPAVEHSISISPREREILQLVSQGYSAKQISANLSISEHTVYTHKKNMLKKFNLNSSNELVKYASSQGLIA